jgi:hypothetical protein
LSTTRDRMLKRIGLMMIVSAAALAAIAALQPAYIDANGFLVEPFGYSVVAALLGILGVVLTELAFSLNACSSCRTPG